MVQKIKKAILVASLLTSLSACTGAQTPSMVDYSYVPPSNVMAHTPTPGLEDF